MDALLRFLFVGNFATMVLWLADGGALEEEELLDTRCRSGLEGGLGLSAREDDAAARAFEGGLLSKECAKDFLLIYSPLLDRDFTRVDFLRGTALSSSAASSLSSGSASEVVSLLLSTSTGALLKGHGNNEGREMHTCSVRLVLNMGSDRQSLGFASSVGLGITSPTFLNDNHDFCSSLCVVAIDVVRLAMVATATRSSWHYNL